MGKVPRYQARLEPIDPAGALDRLREELERARQCPDDAKYSEAQLLAVIERLEAQQRESVPVSKAVTALLADPAGVLADRERWPSLDDLATATDLLTTNYLEWLRERAIAVGGAWEQVFHRSHGWGAPMNPEACEWIGEPEHTADGIEKLLLRRNPGYDDAPLNPEAQALEWMARHVRRPYAVGKGCPELADGFPAAALRDLLPFDGNVHAALILPVTVGSTRMDLFFVVERQERQTMLAGEWMPLPDGWGTAGVVRPWMVAGEPYAPGVEAVWNAACGWWGELSGNPVKRGRGRPAGSGGYRAFGDFLAALREYRDTISSERPSSINALYKVAKGAEGAEAKERFINETWVISPDTLERFLYDEWKVGWPEMVDMVYGPTNRIKSS